MRYASGQAKRKRDMLITMYGDKAAVNDTAMSAQKQQSGGKWAQCKT